MGFSLVAISDRRAPNKKPIFATAPLAQKAYRLSVNLADARFSDPGKTTRQTHSRGALLFWLRVLTRHGLPLGLTRVPLWLFRHSGTVMSTMIEVNVAFGGALPQGRAVKKTRTCSSDTTPLGQEPGCLR